MRSLKLAFLVTFISATAYGQLLQDDSPCIDNGASIEMETNNVDYTDLRTMAVVNGEHKMIPCPVWDWSLVPEECRLPTFNCLPWCGKYPGDKPDIGAVEWFPGKTFEKPWGDWTGVPLTEMPPLAPEAPTNLRRNFPE